MTTIFWFRNDLRLNDNIAFINAATNSDDIIPVFILENTWERPNGGARAWWLKRSLLALKKSLTGKGATLLLKQGDPQEILLEIIKRYNAESLYFDSSYLHQSQHEKTLTAKLSELNIEVNASKNASLINPTTFKTQQGQCYKVFTPFYKSAITQLNLTPPAKPMAHIQQKSKIAVVDTQLWGQFDHEPTWTQGFSQWQPGEKGAHNALSRFIESQLLNYKNNRDYPNLAATSQLSPHLAFGEISANEIWGTLQAVASEKPHITLAADAFLRQIMWREFSYYLYFHFPQLANKNFQPKFNQFTWRKSKKDLTAWQQGQTGYPIVDAGMRELWQTGYMHNRVRMIVASFLTKDLLIDWREGEKWFWDTLVDADIANNAFGWQWVAGSGADAAPYFRIFNPYLQSAKFDKNGDYIRKWVPELAKLDNKHIHNPSLAPEPILEKAGIVLNQTYPLPIVDHAAARQEALSRYQSVRNA